MLFEELMALYSSYQATKNIKRYVTGAKLIFGKKFSINTFPPITSVSPSPVGNRLPIFNSFEELGAGRSYTGGQEYIDTKTYSEIKELILPATVIRAIMEYDGSPYDYLQQHAFNASLMYKGQVKMFRYYHSQMLIEVTTTTDYKVFEKFKAAAAFEKDAQQFVLMAQRNARALAALSLDPALTNDERAKLNIEITKHLYLINDFKSKLPEGFYLDVRQLKADQISGQQIGFIPIIIWVVAIIVAGIVGLTAYYITRQNELAILKATLNDRYKAIMSIPDGPARTKALMDASAADSKTIITQAESTGMLGQVKQIALILGGAFILKELIPLLTRKK